MVEERVTAITGGAGGIGLAIAARLADRGPVLLGDVDEKALASGAEQLRAESGAKICTAVCDVTDGDSVAAFAARASELGLLGVLAHAAGLAPPGTADSARILSVNAGGTARVLDAFLPLATRGTVAVCIASLAGHRSFTDAFVEQLDDPLDPELFARLEAVGGTLGNALRAYSLSKRSNLLEVRRRAAEWGAVGARIVSISPGLIVDTAIGEGAAGTSANTFVAQSAVGRAGYARDVAGVAAFLASDDAGYLTGTDVLVDGGVMGHMLEHADPKARAHWASAGV